MSYPSPPNQVIASTPVRWAIRVLAWSGFALSAFLAWKAMEQGRSIGCTGGGDCDLVQSSIWSVWLGLRVAIAGLACYASLAGLSVLTGLSGPRAVRWVGTPLVMLSLVVALSGLWFTAIQLFVLGHFCLKCMALHVCSFSIAGLVFWSTLQSSRSPRMGRSATTGLMALRAALPAAPGGGAMGVARAAPALAPAPSVPSLAIAAGGAVLLVTLLIGGQILFPAESSLQTTIALNEPIRLDGSSQDQSDESTDGSADPQTYVANLIPIDAASGENVTASHEAIEPAGDAGDVDLTTAGADGTQAPDDQQVTDAGTEPAPAAVTPPRERLVSFLNGKLTLDIYKHPVLGSPEAPHVVLEFVSYECPHCHKMHRSVRKALDRYGDQVAVIVLLVPLEMECNKAIRDPKSSHPGACATARLALCVAQVDPAQFEKLHDWLMADKEKPPPVAQVVRRSQSLVERDRLKALAPERLDRQIGQYVDLFTKIQAQMHKDGKQVGLPLTILGDEVISGELDSDQKVFDAWEAALGVQPNSSPKTAEPQ